MVDPQPSGTPAIQTDKSPDERIQAALTIAGDYGGIDGAHHKQWVIDQMVRILAGDDYKKWLFFQNAGDDGPNTYEWD